MDTSKTILQFSGGKDSTALLYLMRPHLARMIVVFIETGATFPHVVRHVNETRERLNANLVTLNSPVPVTEWIERHGLPSDIVPVEATAQFAGAIHDEAPARIQSYAQCCGAMLWEPMRRYVAEIGATLVLRGAKQSDARGLRVRQFTLDGARYDNPLWEWTDDQVFRYLDQEGAALPEHYPQINDSLDCWLCTAHLKRHGDEKLRFIRERYPDLWPEVKKRVNAVQGVIDAEIARLRPAYGETNG